MASTTPQKSATVDVDIPTSPPQHTIFANRFFVERQHAGAVVYFGFRSAFGQDSPVFGVEVSDASFSQGRQNFLTYLENVGREIQAAVPWTPSRLDVVYSANLIQVSRTGEAAETTFIAASTHAMIELSRVAKKGGKDKVVIPSTALLCVRTPLDMQLSLIGTLLTDEHQH